MKWKYIYGNTMGFIIICYCIRRWQNYKKAGCAKLAKMVLKKFGRQKVIGLLAKLIVNLISFFILCIKDSIFFK